jgi:phage repressor protein C with HTH and peptisase S24 domain
MDIKQTVAAWVRASRTKAGLSQSDLGTKLALDMGGERGYTKGNISHWENAKHEPSLQQLLAISRITEQELPQEIFRALKTGPEVITHSQFSLAIEDVDLARGRRVPIVGMVQGGDDGYLEEFDYPPGHGDGEEVYYGKDPNTYALRVRGDSMAERIMSGDRIIVEPNTMPAGGDIAVVILKDGRKTVKKWLYVRDNELHLAPFNREHQPMVIPMEMVDAMHKVVQIIPR